MKFVDYVTPATGVPGVVIVDVTALVKTYGLTQASVTVTVVVD